MTMSIVETKQVLRAPPVGHVHHDAGPRSAGCAASNGLPRGVDDLLLRNLSAQTGDASVDVLTGRYETASTQIVSNCSLKDWARLRGDTVVDTPLLDCLPHNGHLLKFEGKCGRIKEAVARLARQPKSP